MIVNANYGLNSNLTVGPGFKVFVGNGDVNSGNVYASGLYWASNGSPLQTGINGIIPNAGNSSIVISYPTQSTTATSGALQVIGGAGIGGNLTVGGNINVAGNINLTTGNVNLTQITGYIGQFFGNASGFGALYAGINTGYTFQSQTIFQSSANFNGYSQFNMQNINSGSQASSDYIATADNGTASDTYIDVGIASSTYNYPGFGILKPNDGYVLAYGNVITGGGNLVLTSGLNDIVFAPGGSNANNEFGRINAANVFVVKSTIDSTSNVTGAITVAGGIGVQGNVYSRNIYTSGLYWASNGNIIQTGGGVSNAANVNATLNGATYLFANLLPSANNTYSIGSVGNIAANIYAANLIVTNGITWANGVTWSPGTVQNIIGDFTISGNANIGSFINGNAAFGSITSTVNNVGFIGMPQNSQSTGYTVTPTDQGKQIYITSNVTVTIPANSVTAFPVGTVLTFVTPFAVQATIAINTDSMIFMANGATGSRLLAQWGLASAIKVASTTWYINGAGLS